MALFRPESMTPIQKRACRQIIRSKNALASAVRVYAKMALALSERRGVKLTPDEAWSVLIGDEASSQALLSEIQFVIDANEWR